MTVTEKLEKTGPRKLLALDGGGIRGALVVEVLAEIERMLQAALGRDDQFVLADYFDYIAGTSTGAVMAALLALGRRVDELRVLMHGSAHALFTQARLRDRLYYRYRQETVAGQLKAALGADTLLGSDSIHTLLLLMLCNATTNSPWPLSNNPAALFNQSDHPDCNLRFPLWQLVRASTAAPVYFPPEVITVGAREYVFVDGGLTPYHNPAFQLFLMATVEPYRLTWPAGETEMLLVSLGTGTSPHANAHLRPDQMNLLYNVTSIPSALLTAGVYMQDVLCRVFGRCRAGDPLDSEVGDMVNLRGPIEPKLFTYLRYDADLSRLGLDSLGLPHLRPEQVQQLDAVEHIPALQEVGRAVARNVRPEHFAGFLR